MKLQVELTKKEAQTILGDAIKEALTGPEAANLEVAAVEWDRYGASVIVTLEEPEPPKALPEERAAA